MNRRTFIKSSGILALQGALLKAVASPVVDRPNIVWIMAEDIGPDLSCYCAAAVETPNLDRIRREGALFAKTLCVSPVCSPSRSSMMVGMYTHAVGAHQHRTSNKQALPTPVETLPALLRKGGYYTALGCGYAAKTDLNYNPGLLFDGDDWRHRSSGQPFFAQISLNATHRGSRNFKHQPVKPVDPAAVQIPPQYPDTALMRKDWAIMLETIQFMDNQVGEILQRLETEGILDQTVVVFIGDNGRAQVRGKQFLYEEGLHVPFLVRYPAKIAPQTVNLDLVETIDITASILGFAGLAVPVWMQGRDLFAANYVPREYAFAARDKMDDAHDASRSVRDKRYKYIHNLMPERAWMQYSSYKIRRYPAFAEMMVLYLEGKLTPAQAKFMQPTKPEEELYDLREDPFELTNLAGEAALQGVKNRLRGALDEWRVKVGDPGVTPAFRAGGHSSAYPSHNLAVWKQRVQHWESHIFGNGPYPENLPEP